MPHTATQVTCLGRRVDGPSAEGQFCTTVVSIMTVCRRRVLGSVMV